MAVLDFVASEYTTLYITRVVYANAHNAANADGSAVFGPPGSEYLTLGNILNGLGTFELSRLACAWDTSSIGAAIPIIAARIVIQLAQPAHGTEHDAGQSVVEVVEGTNLPFTVADYGAMIGHTDIYGSGPPYASVNPRPGNLFFIELNAAGMAQINKTGNTTFGLRLFGELSDDLPTGFNDIDILVDEPLLRVGLEVETGAAPITPIINKAFALARDEL